MTARVLVVDDVFFNVKLLETKLKQEYYIVFSASNGKEAIEKAFEIQPDLIIIDIMMPEMDGFEATKIIKNTPQLTHIPIIMVTALNAQEDKISGLRAGADDFITKPIDDHALMTRLKSLIRLKLLTDELRLRTETNHSFGILEDSFQSINEIKGSRVLLIDENPAQIEKIEVKLTSYGLQIDHIDKSSILNTLIQNIEQNIEYKLIIVSTGLPETDVLALCSKIRSYNKTRHIPMLIIADADDTDLLSKSLEIGINDYLVTPLDLNELSARVATQIRRYNYQNALRQNYSQSLSLSITDSLTNLYNRRYFDNYISQLIGRSHLYDKLLSLALIDIDHFKQVNDTYGHQAGDTVITQIANIIQNNIRATDLCARLGGEEFAILMPEIDAQDALNLAERLRAIVAKHKFQLPLSENKTIQCTLSIGVSSLTKPDNATSLIRRTDTNLYAAKRQGRNQVMIGD